MSPLLRFLIPAIGPVSGSMCDGNGFGLPALLFGKGTVLSCSCLCCEKQGRHDTFDGWV